MVFEGEPYMLPHKKCIFGKTFKHMTLKMPSVSCGLNNNKNNNNNNPLYYG